MLDLSEDVQAMRLHRLVKAPGVVNLNGVCPNGPIHQTAYNIGNSVLLAEERPDEGNWDQWYGILYVRYLRLRTYLPRWAKGNVAIAANEKTRCILDSI